MKSTRKLIPALALLVISAILMSTASYAWFSTNTTVTASGMAVKATTPKNLLIAQGSSTTYGTTATTVWGSTKSLNPVTAQGSTTEDLVWKKATSTDPNNATTGALLETVALTNDDGYGMADSDAYYAYETYKFYTTGAESNQYLKISAIAWPDAATYSIFNALKLAVVCDNNIYYFSPTDITPAQTISTSALATSNASPTTITVYYYFDGTHPDCTSVNGGLANGALAGGMVITFGLSSTPAGS